MTSGAYQEIIFESPSLPTRSRANRMEQLTAELDSSFADVETLRKILRGHRVPPELRPKIWKVKN